MVGDKKKRSAFYMVIGLEVFESARSLLVLERYIISAGNSNLQIKAF